MSNDPHIGKQFRRRTDGKIITIVDTYEGHTKEEGNGYIYRVEGSLGTKWIRSPDCWARWERLQ